MDIKVKIYIGNAIGRKINAIKMIREIVGVGHPKGGLTECKEFVEANSNKWVEVVLTDAQFGRLYMIAREKPWDGVEAYIEHDVPERFEPETSVDFR